MKRPTYSVQEIKKLSLTMDLQSMKVLLNLIDEELDLYSQEELIEMVGVSMMLFSKAILLGGIKNLK